MSRKEKKDNQLFCSDQVEDDEQRNESPEETSPWHRKRGIIRKERETANRRKKTLIFSPLADDDKAYLPHSLLPIGSLRKIVEGVMSFFFKFCAIY